MKIKTKFISYLFPVIVLGFILFAGLTLYFVRSNVMKEVKANLVNIASAQQYMIKYFIQDYHDKFNVVSLSRELKSAILDYNKDRSSNNLRILQDILQSKKEQLGKYIKNITLVDNKGIVIASTDKNIISNKNLRYSKETLTKNNKINFFLKEGDAFINNVEGPIFLGEKFLANLNIELDEEVMLAGLYYFPGLGETGKTILLKKNNDGTFMRLEMFNANQNVEQGKIIVSASSIPTEGDYFNEIIQMKEGIVGEYINYHGIPCIGLINAIEGSDWRVLTGIYTSESFSILYKIRNYTLIGLSLVLLLTFGVVLIVTTSITKPIKYLTKSIQNYKETRKWRNLSSVKNEGEIGILANALSETISETQVLEYDLKKQAEHDEVTGLPNRRYFFQTMTDKLKVADPNKDRFAFFHVVLNDMKLIRETFGYEVVDKLLKDSAERLQSYLSKEAMVARFDGDEFVSVFQGYQGTDELSAKASIILNLFIQPFMIEGQLQRLSLNIGIAQYPDDGVTVTDLLKNADISMYAAKKQKADSYKFYTKEISDTLHRMQWIKSELISAIHEKQFEMFYQPQVDSISHKIVGVESLIRWKHPTEGYIRPDEFIEVAEKNQFIHQITDIAIYKSFDNFDQLRQQGILLDKMAINLSVQDFEQGDFPRNLMDHATRFKIPMSHIML
jgi:diguanylate cyclase (GGDEF)-like protein